MLTEAGLAIALSTVLDFIVLWRMPQGGSVTAASMLPIILFAMRWGLRDGLFAGAVLGIVDFLTSPTAIIHPLQFGFDYILAFAMLGLAGLGAKKIKETNGNILYVALYAGLAIFGRFVFHVLSGAIFFYMYAGDQNPWLYSILYNGSFMSVEFIITTIALVLIWKVLPDQYKNLT